MSWIMLEYRCPDGHRMESLEVREEPRLKMVCGDCGAQAERCISAPKIKTSWGSVVRGGSDELPPNVPDTSLLADGMPMKEWREKYTPKTVDHDLRREARRVLDLPDSKLKLL